MSPYTWTPTQLQRLTQLDAQPSDIDRRFESQTAREEAYQQLEKKLASDHRRRLDAIRENERMPGLCRLERKLADVLVQDGFTQVATPIMMSRGLLAKMSIDISHPLFAQIYWIDGNKCLRPMLAPHLYYVLVDLLRLWDKPVRIFEIGPCFRKETRGSQHTSEFTMLNLVEMGLALENRGKRIEDLAAAVIAAAGIPKYHLKTVQSEIYGDTIDIISAEQEIELGSAAMGPHFLDRPWNIHTTWIGIGFGLERLLMVSEGSRNLGRWGRSLAYLDGIRLNI